MHNLILKMVVLTVSLWNRSGAIQRNAGTLIIAIGYDQVLNMEGCFSLHSALLLGCATFKPSEPTLCMLTSLLIVTSHFRGLSMITEFGAYTLLSASRLCTLSPFRQFGSLRLLVPMRCPEFLSQLCECKGILIFEGVKHL